MASSLHRTVLQLATQLDVNAEDCDPSDLNNPHPNNNDGSVSNTRTLNPSLSSTACDFTREQLHTLSSVSDKWSELIIETQKLCADALQNPHLAGHNFTLQDAITRRQKNQLDIDDGTRMGWKTLPSQDLACTIDKDGEILVLFLPNALSKFELAELNDILMMVPEHIGVTTGAGSDQNGRDRPDSYIRRRGQTSGVCILATWKPVGHEDADLLPSRNQFQSATAFAASRTIVRGMETLSIRINTILRFLNPPLYKNSIQLRQSIIEKYDWAKDLLPADPLLMHGRSINFNRQTGSHTDKNGPLGEYTPLIGAGMSKGVKVRLAGIKEILSFEPGTIIFLRGGEIPHAVEAWSGGQRISIACFTHRYIWNEFGIPYPWSFQFRDILLLCPA